MLSDPSMRCELSRACPHYLNAPYGAPCFLTPVACRKPVCGSFGLNAPYGAPCFLTVKPKKSKASKIES